jgi:hypothetical protein
LKIQEYEARFSLKIRDMEISKRAHVLKWQLLGVDATDAIDAIDAIDATMF